MLELSVDTKITTSDGQDMGEVDRFVVDPSKKAVTHVVVRRGMLFPEERVVPIDALDRSDDEVRLRPGIEPDELLPLERSHYVELDPATSQRLTPRSPNALIWAYPIPSMTGFPAYPASPMMQGAAAERRVPEGEVLVSEGASVRSAEGTEIGTIAEVGVADDGSLAHIKVDPGFFRKEEMIPAHWIEEMRPEQVQLAVGDETLDEFGKR